MFVTTTISPTTKKILVVVALAVLFFALRLPGIHLPYHQDEWKNVSASMTVAGAGNFFAHPPLMQMIFIAAYNVWGVDYMRLLPLIFSVGSAILLYLIIKLRFDERTAVISVALFGVCFYNILGSLSPDVDGAILPFFFLLALFAYDKFNSGGADSGKWLALLIIAALLGFLVKLNFFLAIGAIVVDYVWQNRHRASVKNIAISFGCLVAFVLVYIGLLYLIQYLYPAFSISLMLQHANQYSGGRNWTQIIVQGVKAIYYLSPLMLVPLALVSKGTLKKALPFWSYLAVGFLFYFVLFDFSKAALDKYLMFAIVPLAVIVGSILSGISNTDKNSSNKSNIRIGLVIGIITSIILVSLNFLPQTVVALYPKTLWFSRVLHGHWNILTPLNGGSGPLGFYVSFLFIAASYIVSLVVAAIAIFKKSWRIPAVIALVFIGLAYNAVFAEELLHGGLNGSAPKVLADATTFIAKTDGIKQVITYNDIGGGPLTLTGKYGGRIYATPEAEDGYRKKFIGFDGQYLVVNIPRFDPAGFYYKFFAQCKVLFESKSKEITAAVYDCPHDTKTINSL